jgi:hypothetical protein
MISNNYIYENKIEGGTSQDKIKVGVIVIPPFIIERTIEGYGKPKKIYEGIVYDVWTVIKKLNNWNDRVIEIPIEVNYDKNVNDLASGKYDIVVGNFWVFRDRVNKVFMSRSIFMSKIVAVFKPTKTYIQTISKLFLTYFVIPMVIIIILGIVFGYGLYLLEPKRGILRSTRTATATFFGEAGYLFENSTLNIKALFFIYIVMGIAYFFNIVLQGFVTTDIMQEAEKREITMKNISKIKPLIVSNVYDLGEVMEKYGAKYKVVDKLINEVPKLYLSNTDKYSGYLTDYEEAKVNVIEYPDLVITEDTFGFKENSIIVSKSRPELLEKIDKSIVTMHHEDIIGNICKKYMTVEDALYCTL